MFSGRPNPRWELDEESADALRRLVAGLAATGRPPAAPPGLGYRGFVFDGWRAWSGSVVRDGETLADPSLSVERFLADHLPAELQDLRLRIALD